MHRRRILSHFPFGERSIHLLPDSMICYLRIQAKQARAKCWISLSYNGIAPFTFLQNPWPLVEAPSALRRQPFGNPLSFLRQQIRPRIARAGSRSLTANSCPGKLRFHRHPCADAAPDACRSSGCSVTRIAQNLFRRWGSLNLQLYYNKKKRVCQ